MFQFTQEPSLGSSLCLAKATKLFFCVRRYRRGQCYGGIWACCAGARRLNKLICRHKIDYVYTEEHN